MKTQVRVVVALCAALFLQTVVQGAEYFVSKQGSDASSGTSRETAFLTIQKGVDALQPGDTLTIGSGEYFESVKRDNLGNADADTIIRAEIAGTAVLRGDVELTQFKKVEGFQFIYTVDFDGTPLGVLEHDTLTVLKKRPNMRDLEYEPGTFYYDATQKKLYISSSNLRSPGCRRYTVAVSENHAIHMTNPKRVIIDGLVMAGFYPKWSILMENPVSCTIRSCIMYLCEGGINLSNGSKNLVEYCESYGHTFGGIVRYYADDDIIRHCRTYETKGTGERFGIMHYHSMKNTFLIQDNISWGQSFDLSVKPAQQERLERCVALGFIRNGNMYNNLAGGGNEYDPEFIKTSENNILFRREENLDKNFEFADHLNLDFRLQPDSRFRGTSPDGGDRGPYQYEANIFYLSPTGDDSADGLSMRTPWQTLKHALHNLRSGDTLYLAEGTYEAGSWKKAGDGKSPIKILGRGRGTVVITGKLNLSDGTGIVFERLNFTDPVTLSKSKNVTINNCTFSAAADELSVKDVQGLRLTHSVFADTILQVKDSCGLYLSGNVYANANQSAIRLDTAEAIRYSDYNSYQDSAKCWDVKGTTWSFANLQKRHDKYSQTLTPEITLVKGAPCIENSNIFNNRGPHSKALGIHHDYRADAKAVELVGPVLHSTSDTTANIEWWTSKPAVYELAWGETPDMTNTVKNLKAPDRFTTYSLTGLKPGTTYYFQIRSATAANKVLKPEAKPLSFTTLAVAPEPTVYYVAPDGDDASTGLSREKAWRTVSHAADRVNPGDTVLIAEGTYPENVRIRATGDEGKPITFKSIPGEKVSFSGRTVLETFKIVVKKNLHFDALYFEDFQYHAGTVFVLWQGDQVKVTRCFNVKGTGYGGFLSAKYSSDLLVKNCVAAQGGILDLHICPRVRVVNNLFLRPYITAINFVNMPEQPAYIWKNIFAGNLPYKSHAPLIIAGRFESLNEKDNCYFVRLPENERRLFQFYGTAAYGRYDGYGVTTNFTTPPVIVDNPDGTENNPKITLPEYQALAGDTGSYVGDPKFAGTADMEAGGTLWTGDRSEFFDKLLGKKGIDFPDTFATDPKAVEKGIGPEPDAFEDFWFNKNK